MRYLVQHCFSLSGVSRIDQDAGLFTIWSLANQLEVVEIHRVGDYRMHYVLLQSISTDTFIPTYQPLPLSLDGESLDQVSFPCVRYANSQVELMNHTTPLLPVLISVPFDRFSV